MAQRVGLYGGTFDPIHHGHLIVARSVREQLALDRLVFIPAAHPPHKLAAARTPFDHRVQMIRLAIADEPAFDVDECESRRPGPSYTYDTVQHFRNMLAADAELFWLIGADSFGDLPGWYRIADLVSACQLITVSRPGWEPEFAPLQNVLTPSALQRLRNGILTTPRVEISATDIRRRVAAGRSIRYLVPEATAVYITTRQLYLAEQPSSSAG
ncbi:MAG: Nicotinate-nucleotide adenylyltransferase [Phycisphaerae bacterium]|nr:Nicotinate-nucleotide adenylyltransferase [Phycisphaerae bacterium]